MLSVSAPPPLSDKSIKRVVVMAWNDEAPFVTTPTPDGPAVTVNFTL
jgi:hypothetical protein